MPTDWDKVGRAAYEAYLESHGNGLAATWEELSDREKRSWVAAATAAVRAFLYARLELRRATRHG